MDRSHYGGHLGLKASYERGRVWNLTVRAEGMALGSGYTWSVFDQGYLIDRWTGLTNRLAATRFALGGRLDTQFEYRDALILGGQFATCSQDGRHDLSAFARVPFERATISASWRVRAPDKALGLLDPGNALAAFAARFILMPPLSAELLIAHDWRVDAGDGRFHPTTTALLSIAASWASE